jgi:hypothetical protein
MVDRAIEATMNPTPPRVTIQNSAETRVDSKPSPFRSARMRTSVIPSEAMMHAY